MKNILLAAIALMGLAAHAQTVIEVNTKKVGSDIAPTMYGVFFEDINYGADGGLYAEMVKNRSFEYPQALMGWNSIGGVEVKDDGPFERCPHYVRLSFSGKRDKATGLENRGHLGMSLHGNEKYRFSLWARVPQGGEGQLSVVLRNLDSQEENFAVAEQKINVSGSKEDKFAAMKLTKEAADIVKCPMIAESPLNLECRVVEKKHLGSHDMFLAEIVAVHVDEKLFDENDKIRLDKAGLVALVHGAYYAVGREKTGRMGYSVMKPATKKRLTREGKQPGGRKKQKRE